MTETMKQFLDRFTATFAAVADELLAGKRNATEPPPSIPIGTPQDVFNEFVRTAKDHSIGRREMELMTVCTNLVIAKQLERIADALEKKTATALDSPPPCK